MSEQRPSLPDHLEDTVRTIAELHARHDRQASFYQRSIQRLIEQLGRPGAVALIFLAIAVWIVTNLAAISFGKAPIDPAPFAYLQVFLSAAALITTVLILTSQRHENRLAQDRAQLTLQLAMVSEQKVAKLIELLERQRRDNPQLADRVDPEAADMAKSADPHAIFEAIRETHGDLIAGDREN